MTIELHDFRIDRNSEAFSLALHRGEITGLAGLERAGQAEVLLALSGLRRPASLRITGLGDGVEKRGVRNLRDAFRQGIAYLPRDRKTEGILAGQSVIANFSIATISDYSTLGLLRKKRERRTYEHFRERLGIVSASPNSAIRTLSGGNQQKVLLARWLAAAPTTLLLNDPSRGVDHRTKLAMYDILRGLADDGVAVVILSSEIEELLMVADRTHVFHDRTLVASLSRERMTRQRILDAMFGSVDD